MEKEKQTLEQAQKELENIELEAIKRDYPNGLPIGSPMWYAWKDKIKK